MKTLSVLFSQLHTPMTGSLPVVAIARAYNDGEWKM